MPERSRKRNARRGLPFVLHVGLEGERNVASQIYRQLRDAALDGRLPAGSPLPSTRELARTLRVARNTVVVVYERLRAEGFLESRRGSGTFVRGGLSARGPVPTPPSPLRSRAQWRDVFEAPDMSGPKPEYDFRPGIPDVAQFPHAALRARVARQLYPVTIGSGAHIGPAGVPAFRAAIARHLGISRGVRATPDDVFVTNGLQQALDLVARVLLEPGDVVAVEDPGYPIARAVFQAHGCRVVGVPLDAEGLMVEAIPEGCRLVYVTPSHQYPLGMPLSPSRREALLDWAAKKDGVIVEDDYDSEFRFHDRPLETLHTLDPNGRVLFLGSFSKVLLPTLRLGFAILPESLHAAFRRAKGLADWHTATPFQHAVADLIDDGILAHYLRKMRRRYAQRHDRLVLELGRQFGDRLSVLPAIGGLHLTATLDHTTAGADLEVAEDARRRGVAVLPLSRHYADTTPRAGLLIGYGAIPTARIEAGVRVLRECL